MAILLEEFFSGTLADWTVTDEADATNNAPSSWAISSVDDVRQSTDIFGTPVPPRIPGTFLTYDLGASWTLYTTTLRMLSSDNDILGFMVYYQDVNNYVQYYTNSQGSQEILWEKVAGVQTELASNSFSYLTNKWYDFEILLASGTINVKREGVEIFGGPISIGLSTGTVGLYSAANNQSVFDTIIVDDNISAEPEPVVAPLMVVNAALNQGSGVFL